MRGDLKTGNVVYIIVSRSKEAFINKIWVATTKYLLTPGLQYKFRKVVNIKKKQFTFL